MPVGKLRYCWSEKCLELPRSFVDVGFSQFKTDKNVFISAPEFFQERFQICFADEILVDQSQSFYVFIHIFVEVKLLCDDGMCEEKASR